MKSFKLRTAFASILFAGISGLAQVQPSLENGFKDYGSVHGSSIDSVNLSNGNWMLHSPLIPDIGQRGDLTAHYFISVNSKNWQIKCIPNSATGQTCFWVPGRSGPVLERSNDITVHRTLDMFGSGTGTVTYEGYGDADGNRVEKSNGSTGTIYWYMSPGIVAESNLSGNLKSEYVFFDGERVARKDFPGNSVFYYFSDHLKTASVITDSAGTTKEDEDYYPWGGELQFVNNDSNHYKFTSKERDSETGLDYFGARYYGNWLGRFITPDWAAKPVPIPYVDLTDPQTLNQYAYTRDIPTSKTDADGHGDAMTRYYQCQHDPSCSAKQNGTPP